MGKKYVETVVNGGLGNQIFQFSAGFALSKRLNLDLVLNISTFDSCQKRNFELYTFPKIKNSFACIKDDDPGVFSRLRIPFLNFKEKIKQFHESHFFFDPAFFDIREPVRIEGYFQSYKYFEKYSDQLKDILLDIPLTSRLKTVLKVISSKKESVSVHIRRGDYISDQGINEVHGTLNEAYYLNSIKLMEKMFPESFFFLFTDDPHYVEENFKFLEDTSCIISDNDCLPYEDMYLMANCHHNIIANSSFSWWGAWLNQNPEKIVIAPRKWFSRKILMEKPVMDLLPDDWILL
ncbi:alpha-1,2-fucosyltransferase [Desulfospira joergensenii]|uniref:alpha-1,2-fucosyltransferase n=1 Tax=Desulfospira joergensenii TaxID=53329 RepID=UPI0003B68810|nr:alpha-1,2-fucosyltransferase [Desulfospira joergensenii]